MAPKVSASRTDRNDDFVCNLVFHGFLLIGTVNFFLPHTDRFI